MTTLENGAITFGDTETVDVVTKRGKTEVDLTPYKAALLTELLPYPPLTKAVPVVLTNQRGHSAASVKARFIAALEELDGNIPNMDASKIKLTFRNAHPGVMPITKFYVKWQPKDTEEKTDDKKKDKK